MSNPILSDERWSQIRDAEDTSVVNTNMTIAGVINKSILLLVITLVAMGFFWATFFKNGQIVSGYLPWMIGGAIVGLLCSLAAMFLPRWTGIIAPLYAGAQGVFLGGFTLVIEKMYPGIPVLAAVFTTATLFGMLFLFKTGIVKVSKGFVTGVVIATAGLFLGIGVLALLGLFGIGGDIMATLRGNGPIGIGFSALCIILATFNLLVNFWFIKENSDKGAPKYMEWVGAFGLLATLIWLYIEIVIMLTKLRGQED